METRAASTGDAGGKGRVLRETKEHTGRQRYNDAAFVIECYIAAPTSIRCTVAVDPAGGIVGFQSLKNGRPDR